MRRRTDELTTGEWAVLALADEGATHGFAIAQELAPDGDIGQVWSMPKPRVYRALDVLASFDLTREVGTEPSTTGPPRTLVATSDDGQRRVEQWLEEPIERVRDARSDLMLKLLFIQRRRADPSALLEAQREQFTARIDELRSRLTEAEGFAHTLTLWRMESTAAAVRFVETLEFARRAR